MTRHFTAELATEFERSLHSVNAAITRTWLPGLTDSEIDALSRPHDLDLPEEARVWWRWHNGAAPYEVSKCPRNVSRAHQSCHYLEIFPDATRC